MQQWVRTGCSKLTLCVHLWIIWRMVQPLLWVQIWVTHEMCSRVKNMRLWSVCMCLRWSTGGPLRRDWQQEGLAPKLKPLWMNITHCRIPGDFTTCCQHIMARYKVWSNQQYCWVQWRPIGGWSRIYGKITSCVLQKYHREFFVLFIILI